MSENWERAYREAPEIFDAFTRAEDPEGRVVSALTRDASLAGRVVLEIGCGTGRYTESLAPGAGRYLGLERTAEMLALARERLDREASGVELLCGDARSIPLPDGTVERALALWVLVNMKPPDRRRALVEIDRVLVDAPGPGLWLVENHWSGEFQALRGKRAEVERARIRDLIDAGGFTLVEEIATELRFPSEDDARRVLGYLCGDEVRTRLTERPRARIGHHVIILRR